MKSKLNDTLKDFQEKVLDTGLKTMAMQIENKNKVLLLSIIKTIIDTIQRSITSPQHYNNSNIYLTLLAQQDTISKASISDHLITQTNWKF